MHQLAVISGALAHTGVFWLTYAPHFNDFQFVKKLLIPVRTKVEISGTYKMIEQSVSLMIRNGGMDRDRHATRMNPFTKPS